MKTKSLKNAIAATSLLVGLAGALSAQADPFEVFFEDLGAPASFTDVYSLTCPIGTVGVAGNVTDLFPVVPPLVSLQIFKPLPVGLPYARNTTDPVDGNIFSSPTVTLNKGPGQYYLLVDKTGFGAERYRINVHCNGVGIFHFTPAPVLIQDQ